jgi:transcriptional regulator GlxA family with amidase domain
MGLYDLLNSFNLLSTYSDALADRAHFQAEIVATTAGSLSSASGVPVEAKRSIDEVDSADVIIEQAARISGIPERSFKRRFKSATGHAPIDYVQRLRVEEAKRRLEQRKRRWMRSARRWATKTPRFFAGYSNGLPG